MPGRRQWLWECGALSESARQDSAAIWSVMLVAARERSSRFAVTLGSLSELRYDSARFFSARLAA